MLLKPKMRKTTSPLIALLASSLLTCFSLNVSAENVSLANEKTGAVEQNWSPASGFANLIERVSPAVVHVAIKGDVRSMRRRGPRFNIPPGFEDFFGPFGRAPESEEGKEPKKKQLRPLGIGSGFIISADGYVVTNHHVIKNADEIIVTLTDGTEYEAELKGSDNKTDLALLKLKGAKKLPFVAFGNDEKSRVGDWVLAIGNPFGLGGSASTGIISARGRDINSGPYDNYIQVDAAINRGNSGGPLFNMHGEVIGVNTAIYSPNGGSVGVGFSIPATQAKNVIKQLKEDGQVERGWIGVQIQVLSDDLAKGFGRDNDEGALISSVIPNKPAAKAGLKSGDIILSFNGEAVKEMRDLPRIVAQTPVGEKSKVVVWRDGKKKTLSIQVDAYPSDTDLLALSNGEEPGETAKEKNALGATVAALNSENRKKYRVDERVNGVLILDVQEDSLAFENGLRRGDVLSSFDRKSVKTPEQLEKALAQAKSQGKKKVVILLRRGNNDRFLPFNLEQQ